MSNTVVTIQQLKSENQDFQWYPTDDRIIGYIANELSGKYHDKYFSLLDIGAGNGNLFKILADKYQLTCINKYAIEKSSVLTGQMPPDVFIVGTDFHQQTLIDKQVDVIFCNPPYTEYAEWIIKIIKESLCDTIYAVIPKRWKENQQITEAIRLRGAITRIIGSFDFTESVYRQARTEVDIVAITVCDVSESWGRKVEQKVDPFELWFDEHFKINIESSHHYDDESNKKQEIQKQCDLVKGQNLIERLVELYDIDLKHLTDNYIKLSELDSSILKELGADTKNLREGLKLKIKGLKNLYWQELFNRLDVLIRRLTTKSRQELLNTLKKNTSIDFTVDNVYAVVIWAIKNSNQYIDKQLLEVYHELSRYENIKNYKSNHVMYDDEWRYRQDMYANKVTKYKLDYRLVLDRSQSLEYSHSAGGNRLTESAINLLNDIIVIAGNLGFEGYDRLPDHYSPDNKAREFGTEYEFRYFDDVLMVCRFYKNGNIHIKPNQDFIRKFNVEAARLNGWIKSPREYADETGESFDIVSKDYGCNLVIQKNNVGLLSEAAG